MHRPNLSELPPPPASKACTGQGQSVGWPWTEQSEPLSDTMLDGSPWPRVSIITPSYNQGQFIEETIRSVLLQDYPNLEYIVMDGGSTDGSIEIIGKYEPWLTYWVSEQDNGQSNAINKGFAQATGQVLAWLNSDDTYLPDTVSTAMYHLLQRPEWAAVYGTCEVIDSSGMVVGRFAGREFDLCTMLHSWSSPIPQPSCFFRRVAFQDVGLIDETLHWCMDIDLWARLGLCYALGFAPSLKACYRVHSEAKSVRAPLDTLREWKVVCDKVKSNDRVGPEIRKAATEQVIPYLRLASQLHKEGHSHKARSLLTSTVLRYPWKLSRGYWTPVARVMLSSSAFDLFQRMRHLLSSLQVL